MSPIITLVLTLIIGSVLGGGIAYFLALAKNKTIATKIIEDAEKTGKSIITRAEESRDIARNEIEEARNDLKDRKQNIVESENRLTEKETRLDKKLEEIEVKRVDIMDKEQVLEIHLENADKKAREVESRLQEIAKLSQEDAKNLLLQYTEERYEKDILSLIEKKKKDLKSREEEAAREIIIKAIQQYAGEVCGETTQTLVTLESDDLKGKLIGKEGRNIIAFEKATGVSLIIDDAPDTVFLSSFDLFRRYIAKKSLEELIEDKRIQPARIEEIVEKNQAEADKLIYDLGRKTVDEMGVIGIPDEIFPLIGKFRFRTSYGQNILMHSKEVAYIAEAIARLIGADPVLALKG